MTKLWLVVLGNIALVSAVNAQQTCEPLMNISVKGSITESDVLKTVKPAIPRLQKCYSHLLKKHKTAAGRVVITSYLAKSGKVDSLDVCTSERLSDPRLTTCIKRHMRRLVYPGAITPSEVKFPLDLSPK